VYYSVASNSGAQRQVTVSVANQPLMITQDGACDSDLLFAKNASAGIALRCRAFVTVMQAAKVRNLYDRSDTRDLPNMWTLLVES
jgi:hypothetical protein